MDYRKMLSGAGYASSLAEMIRIADIDRASNALRQIEETEKLRSIVSQQSALQLLKSDHLHLARDIASLGFGKTMADYMSEQDALTIRGTLKNVEQVTRELHATSYYEALRHHVDGIGSTLSRYISEDFLREHTSLYKSMAAFQETLSLRTLAELKNSPFSYLDDDFLSRLRDHIPEDDEEDLELPEISDEVRTEIAATDDFNLLSDGTKKFLYYFLHALYQLMLGIYLSMAWEQLAELKKVLQAAETKAEVRSLARHTDVSVDRETLKNYRVTIRPLNLREQPGMEGEIVVTLPIGTLVQVLDKSRRSWLLVETEVDGEIEQGWVSRRYTAVLR